MMQFKIIIACRTLGKSSAFNIIKPENYALKIHDAMMKTESGEGRRRMLTRIHKNFTCSLLRNVEN